MRLLCTCLLLLNCTLTAYADVGWPGADYDAAIPRLADVVGHAPGERITGHRDAVRYLEALAAAAPDRIQVHRYATSWEGRELVYAVVSSADNMRRLDTIRDGMQRLRSGASDAESLLGEQRAVTWLSYGVHGDEISSTDAALLTAYHLLAARNDDRVPLILDNTVVIIDPMQNPDGRDRFVHHYESTAGLVPDASPLAAERNQPWPGGRTNHYLFDLNRDWFIMTQPETRGRIAIAQQWYPVVFVDAHEMGTDETYFFAPDAVPFNPHLAAGQRASQSLYGRNNARWFDRFGIDYFTREVYDALYPGYGASWPAYFGSVAMTYEQGSARGLRARRFDGVEFSYADAVRNHFVASLATAETTAMNRERLLREFYDYQLSAIAEGSRGPLQSVVVPTQNDQAGADRLAGLLAAQGVHVERADEAFAACGVEYAAGSYVINLAQPAKRLIRTLLDPQVAMETEFVEEQERRRAKGLGDEIYDVTAWSLPLMLNVRVDACGRAVEIGGSAVDDRLRLPGTVAGAADPVAWLVPWRDAGSARLLTNALRLGLAVKSADTAFRIDGGAFPAGTLIIDAADNGADVGTTLQQLATQTGADIVGVDNSWVSDGPSFGSPRIVPHFAPRIAIAWDSPTSPNSAGHTRFVIERQFDYPLVPVRTRQLADNGIDEFDVIILPEASDGGYLDVLGTEGADHLRDWIARGGVLIGLGNANRFLADPSVDLVSIRRENAVAASTTGAGDVDDAGDAAENDDDAEDTQSATVDGNYLTSSDDWRAATAPVDAEPDSLGGALLRADVDADHWLGAGLADTLHVLARGSDVYTPLRRDDGVNAVSFRSADDIVASGYVWDENRRQLAYKPFVAVQPSGQGFVISFTQDPTVRAYLDGLNLVVINAIFRGAAHARKR